MSAAFFVIAVIGTLSLAGLLIWALRGASHRKTNDPRINVFESAPRHLRNMAQIRQAMDSRDLQYAEAKGGPHLSARIRRERRQVTLLYLAAIRRVPGVQFDGHFLVSPTDSRVFVARNRRALQRRFGDAVPARCDDEGC